MATNRYEVDPRLTIDEDGADLEFVGGQPIMDAGLENAVLISLFTKDWFGNVFFDDPNQRIGGRFLDSFDQPLSISAVESIRKAALSDLKWLIDEGIASAIEVTVTNPESKKISVVVLIKPPGKDIQALLLEKNGVNWINQILDPASESRSRPGQAYLKGYPPPPMAV